VFLLEGLGLTSLGFQVCVDLGFIRVVVGERGVNLCQRQVAKLPHDLFWNQTHVVPLGDPANRHARASYAWAPTANVRASRDQATDFGHGCHRFRVYRLVVLAWALRTLGDSNSELSLTASGGSALRWWPRSGGMPKHLAGRLRCPRFSSQISATTIADFQGTSRCSRTRIEAPILAAQGGCTNTVGFSVPLPGQEQQASKSAQIPRIHKTIRDSSILYTRYGMLRP
jgi:hypothetical protein